MTDLRTRLQIPPARLEALNDLLLSPGSRVINDMLAVVAKYGTPEEINAKARAARDLPALLQAVNAKRPEYLADLMWLEAQRDRGAFVSIADYRRSVLGERADSMTFKDSSAVTLEISALQYFPWVIAAAQKAIAERSLMPGRWIKVRKMKEQEADGKWWGRWGVNYIYGTWSALSALRAVKEPLESPCMVKGAEWLTSVQNADGGWGETCRSYEGGDPAHGPSCASQTAWAIMGLLAAGQGDSESCRRGVEWLLAKQNREGGWDEDAFTGTGFPGVFYLRYHLYRLYFPLLALARFRDLVR